MNPVIDADTWSAMQVVAENANLRRLVLAYEGAGDPEEWAVLAELAVHFADCLARKDDSVNYLHPEDSAAFVVILEDLLSQQIPQRAAAVAAYRRLSQKLEANKKRAEEAAHPR